MESWIITKVELDIDKNETNRFVFKEFTVTSDGKVLDETEFNTDASVANKRIYRYFETGEVKLYVEYDPFDELLERHTYVETEFGEIDKIIYEYADGHKTVKEFHYTDLGFADRATLRDEQNAVTGYELYVLNDEGQVVEQVETNADNIETARYLKVYHENGLPIRDTRYLDGKLTEEVVYTYDEKGNLIRKITTNITQKFDVIDEYTYDNRGNMLHNISFQNGVVVFENTCTYDDTNSLLTEQFFEIDYWEKRITRHEKLIHERKV